MSVAAVGEGLLESPAFGLAQEEKRRLQIPLLRELCELHYERCATYRNVVDRAFGGREALAFERLESMPFLPVSLFKSRRLSSVDPSDVVCELRSSGTTGEATSRVYLDSETARAQSTALVRILQHYLGHQRVPLVVLDHRGSVAGRGQRTARSAATMGMLQFARKPLFLMDERLEPDLGALAAYLGQHSGQRVALYGLTWVVWRHFLPAIEARGLPAGTEPPILFHTGGWKKLQAEAVEPDAFRRRLRAAGIGTTVDFYGMAEQVGSVFFENELGGLQCPSYSEVIVRDPLTLEPLPEGDAGLVQVVSVLPRSYPGHSILTEDLGVIRGTARGEAGVHGRYFEILGRVPRAEQRGCSDTMTG